MNTVVNEVVGGLILAVLMFVLGSAWRHWWRELRRFFGRVEETESVDGPTSDEELKRLLHRYLTVIEPRTRQLERNSGSHLADVVYETRDLLRDHLKEARRDSRQLASLKRRFDAHMVDANAHDGDGGE